MTKFQDNCITQVKAIFSSVTNLPKVDFQEEHLRDNNFKLEVVNLLRRAFGFAEIPYKGKELAETCFVARFRFKSYEFEIYINDDNASFHRDDVGYLCEQLDYNSETEMIKDFAKHLSEALSNEYFEGNCKTSGKEWLIILGAFTLLTTAIIGGGFWLFRFLSKHILR